MVHAISHASSTQLELDLTPRPDADISKRVIDFLRSEPSADDVARELVLQFLAPFDARASVISIVKPDATLRVIGTFGVPDCAVHPGFCSVWDDFPSAAAVRLRRPVVATCAEQCAAAFPDVRQRGLPDYSVAALPLLTSITTVGAISVYFASEGPTVEAATQTVQAIADVYVLFLASTFHAMVEGQPHETGACCPPEANIEQTPILRTISRNDLTQRQLSVLALLSEDLTYDQIAVRIGYSHSTVREELMHVYRMLGVRSRRDAVREAAKRGILEVNEDRFLEQPEAVRLLGLEPTTR